MPEVELDLHGGNLGDRPRVLDLADGDVAKPIASIRPSRFSAASARTLVENGVRGSGACSW